MYKKMRKLKEYITRKSSDVGEYLEITYINAVISIMKVNG
jgi:hypothetical protein